MNEMSKMSANVEIGKFTLESLTTGMYEQPLIVYREFLQNAADSLEEAVRSGMISEKEMCVNITIDPELREIEIYDNGTGISEDKAASVLLSVGSSQKIHTQSRGFRGIGRLGGISYCDKLQFETSAFGSKVATIVTFDCLRLKELMLPGESSNMTMERVLDESNFLETIPAKEDDHYFVVRMMGVDERTGLLEEDSVREYLSQIAPVTYSAHFRLISDKIYSFLHQNGVDLTEFPVFIRFGNEHPKPIHKAFSRRYSAGRGKNNEQDTIYEAQTFQVIDEEHNLLALGWYGIGSWPGTIKDAPIRGLRLRKGNIQIGDEHTLDPIFGKQTRFNGWSQGEVFVVDERLIPNARRDDFEKNTVYWSLMKALTEGIGNEISERIVTASRKRNDPTQKLINAGNDLVEIVRDKQGHGFNSMEEAAQARADVEQALSKLQKSKSKDAETTAQQQITQRNLLDVLENLGEGPSLKIDRLKGILNKKEKKILQVASDVMTEFLEDQLLDPIMDEIVDRLLK